ncbi:MAG: hypothetical protein XXXJIFNMEKO3_00581 [Candidatus Erwinia impunctatus]|nr:hypothetical protein XXXJIFNMEKO_00581 [Culicoides impunctatus]
MHHRTLRERVLHAVGYEGIACLIVVPFATWLLDKSLLDMGILTISLSSLAMVWNMVYNMMFDRFFPSSAHPRSTSCRVWHALGFEGGFLMLALPLSAWMLEMSLWQVFLIDIGFFLFYLPYTYLYNLVYDALRIRVIASRRHPESS